MKKFLLKLEEALEAPDLPEEDEWDPNIEYTILWSTRIGEYEIEFVMSDTEPRTYRFTIDEEFWPEVPIEKKEDLARKFNVEVDRLLNELHKMISAESLASFGIGIPSQYE